MSNAFPLPTRQTKDETVPETNVVASILEQIPDLTKVKQVRKRDGSLVDFAPEKIGLALQAALKDAGVNDSTVLARATHQAIMRIDREFDGHAIPTTEDIARTVPLELID